MDYTQKLLKDVTSITQETTRIEEMSERGTDNYHRSMYRSVDHHMGKLRLELEEIQSNCLKRKWGKTVRFGCRLVS